LPTLLNCTLLNLYLVRSTYENSQKPLYNIYSAVIHILGYPDVVFNNFWGIIGMPGVHGMNWLYRPDLNELFAKGTRLGDY
jgi:hypothetical protein